MVEVLGTMNGISPTTAAPALQLNLSNALNEVPDAKQLEARDKFEEFVAGTFYSQMLKALRSAESKPAYFHGGQAEETFRGQLDQHVVESLAQKRGGGLAEPLFNAFALHLQQQLHRSVGAE